MSTCPKCGCGPISGPIYSREGVRPCYPHECLLYWCQCCGYRWETPTEDKKQQPEGSGSFADHEDLKK